MEKKIVSFSITPSPSTLTWIVHRLPTFVKTEWPHQPSITKLSVVISWCHTTSPTHVVVRTGFEPI